MWKQLQFLLADIKRWKMGTIIDFFYMFFELGFWAVIFYRLSRFLFLIRLPIIRILSKIFSFLLYKISEITLGTAISASADIGPGLFIGHTGVIRIHPDVKAGTNLNIGQLVAIGTKGVGHKGVPVIGNNVYIGVGAKVLGNIKIGNNVKIGANAVVITDIPDDSTAVGIPARIVKTNN